MNVALAAKTASSRQQVIGKEDPRWKRLRDIVDERALKRGTFKLSSGGTSNFFFQLRQATMFPEGQALIGDIVTEFMKSHRIKCVGGLEMGAVPVVCAVALTSFNKADPVAAFFVRKKAKEHGARELIDGDLPPDVEALMVDDVTTSGKSVIAAIENARSQVNFDVKWALSVVDRDQGAAANLAEHGIQLVSIFTKADFGL